jgi:hypothetical protein
MFQALRREETWKKKSCGLLLLLLFAMLEMELWASTMLGKYSTTGLYSQLLDFVLM